MDLVKKVEGRPTIYSDTIVKSLVKSFEDGSTVTEACHIAGISRQIFYYWMKEHKDFFDRISVAQEYPDYVARSLITSAMKSGDVDTAKWWAERRMKGEFSARAEITGKDGERLMPNNYVSFESDDPSKTSS